MPKKSVKRVFTRADVIAYMQSFWRKYGGTYVYEIRAVSLVPQIPVPAWEVAYKVIYEQTQRERYNDTMIVLQQKQLDGTPYLIGAYTELLPEDCPTPQAEDLEIKRRHEAERAEW